MVKDMKHDVLRSVNATFKSDFTSRFGGTLVRCRVPENGAITFEQKSLVSPGEEFCAIIKRCHLSSTVHPRNLLYADVPDEPTINLEFCFDGEILLDGSIMQWYSDNEAHPISPVLFSEADWLLLSSCWRFDLRFPASWIHSVGHQENGHIHMIPVPRWDAEIGDMRRTASGGSHSSAVQ